MIRESIIKLSEETELNLSGSRRGNGRDYERKSNSGSDVRLSDCISIKR